MLNVMLAPCMKRARVHYDMFVATLDLAHEYSMEEWNKLANQFLQALGLDDFECDNFWEVKADQMIEACALPQHDSY